MMNPNDDHHETLLKAARLARRLSPLVRRIDSNGFSAEDRAHFRELVEKRRGGESTCVFDLSNYLNHLCGETARNMHRNPERERLRMQLRDKDRWG